MPTVLRYGPYRFFFYSGDQDEPPHVHDRDECEAKFWLTPIRLERTRGFKPSEVRDIRAIVEEYEHELLESWNAFFGT